jgi:energy-coupling factor transporter ATP-binding protein EcfA2
VSAVRWENVSHDFGAGDVLHDVSLDIAAGESVALLGHNGAGKTTLTRMLVALVQPRAGRVSVGDWDVRGRRPDEMATRVGYCFQHADQQLFARTVRDDVAFGPRKLGLDPGIADEVLEELGLAPYARRHPYDLPAPLRKLVTLAGVLAMQQGVCVFDEPTAGFDRDLRERVIDAVRKRMNRGVTMLYVSHDRAFMDAVARRRVVLDAGHVTEDSAA